jgi:hypothetical protein
MGLPLTGPAVPTLPLGGTLAPSSYVPPRSKLAPEGPGSRTLPLGGTLADASYVPPEGKVGW